MRKKRNILEQTSRKSQGIYDSLPASEFDEVDEFDEIEVGLTGQGPIDPVPQMSVQLSVAEPPIEDEDFEPTSSESLANSASALSRAVPDDEISWFYKQLHKLVDKANDRSVSTHRAAGEDITIDGEETVEMQEESIKKTIRRSLYEILASQDEDEFDRYRAGDDSIDYFGEEEFEELQSDTNSSDEAVSLEDMAAEFGYSGAPGMRQEIQRITDKMSHFSNKIKKDDLEAMMGYAVGEYIDTLEATDALDTEDLEDLRSAPTIVRDLDSFRFFFVGAFVLPAYREISRESLKKVKQGIAELELPKGLDQTLLNQVTGGSQKNPQLIRDKITKLVKSGELSLEEVESMAKKISSAMPALKQASELSDDLVERSLAKWASMSRQKRAVLLNQAMDNTAEV
jgi:hypothetical protein